MNYNSDITIQELSLSDLYDGIIVQSFGNVDCIYELNFIDDDMYYTTVARRETKHQPFMRVLNKTPYRYAKVKNNWCITTNSINFDVPTQRNNKLIDLGI